MQEVETVEDEDANKRRRQVKKRFSPRRLRQALFLSGVFCAVGLSVSAFASETDDAADPARKVSSHADGRKEICLFRSEQRFWESFGTDGPIDQAFRTDAAEDCADVLSGEDVFSSDDRSGLEKEIAELVSGYPIEAMAPFIASYDREVAALLIGIAKKESGWGKHVPLDGNGSDCFNYWGYKGAGARGVEMGHGCFGSPEEAVRMVGNRLVELVALRQTSNPRSMIIWKCGSSCAGHSPESVRKWIADVSLYYDKIVRF